MTGRIAIIGFGEAAQAFADAWRPDGVCYDPKLEDPRTATAKSAEAAALSVASARSNREAVACATLIVSLVTADQAIAAATASAAAIALGAVYMDMNSVSPETKRQAARRIEQAGGRYVDVAVMSPVLTRRCATQLLASGPQADAGVAALRGIGFSNVRSVGLGVGDASAVKMIRSVMVKGIEALSAECVLAADAAGVLDEVLASLDASWPGSAWRERFDYNLDRMMVHGCRRAAEMDEVVATLEVLGTGAPVSRGTAEWQRHLGGLGIVPPDGLGSKLAALAPFFRRAAGVGDRS